jgi:2-polyprenyl-3-methyl-5-hydroxy-6-metoxy-1,4-benzoquinol methylase
MEIDRAARTSHASQANHADGSATSPRERAKAQSERAANSRRVLRNIVNAFDSAIVRVYCRGRFIILHQRFLEEIGQYLPDSGSILDIGCGFGLFSLYYAQQGPERKITGVDLNATRIEYARRAAVRLGVTNVEYRVGNATDFHPPGGLACAYMLDIIHHIDRASAGRLLDDLYDALVPGGLLIVKDVTTTPTYKRWFTWLLDKGMDMRAPVDYWPKHELEARLRQSGFVVHSHAMLDVLPYPHQLYLCRKRPEGPGLEAV